MPVELLWCDADGSYHGPAECRARRSTYREQPYEGSCGYSVVAEEPIHITRADGRQAEARIQYWVGGDD